MHLLWLWNFCHEGHILLCMSLQQIVWFSFVPYERIITASFEMLKIYDTTSNIHLWQFLNKFLLTCCIYILFTLAFYHLFVNFSIIMDWNQINDRRLVCKEYMPVYNTLSFWWFILEINQVLQLLCPFWWQIHDIFIYLLLITLQIHITIVTNIYGIIQKSESRESRYYNQTVR